MAEPTNYDFLSETDLDPDEISAMADPGQGPTGGYYGVFTGDLETEAYVPDWKDCADKSSTS